VLTTLLSTVSCLASCWLQVDIVSAGDFVNELHLILAGHAASERGNAGDTQLAADGTTSIHGASLLLLGPGDSAGEMAFFTETPSMEVRGQAQGEVVVVGLAVAGVCSASCSCCLAAQELLV
jgi:CRP-like cAMP-binding protein